MKTNSRRKFIENTLKATVIAAVGGPILLKSASASVTGNHYQVNADEALKFTQVLLGFDYKALEPHIDALTMEIHYTRHHTSYIKNVNEAIIAEKLTFTSEKDFFDNASKLSARARNNGGGAWNHNFFWQSLKPGTPAGPDGKVKKAIISSFGSVEKFKELFSQAALTRFGSGWAWLINDNGTLKITSTANQDNPLFNNAEVKGTPLLALDVWEHAYYLKYQNKRNEYITGWWNVVNWDEVNKRLV
ncbi:superoxide dismutase [Mucilaginibacter lappiensis]|uniref:Superoxide dismutase n=1 Tax=Mucilaginibacter lappiensis TaxID=354630 RepID=A0A1N7EV87_9SPHI|nr:superoxide dismutase [Mucilaginibacter lappiensis]MBB6112012.1 Fe-Mn family superoxide dismutase [Mucilaginibacter lappiensis]MBB6126470.1 Fe-Mn family superoxide dismutase [Mucilaginibacter lappiensis]SIR91969.1 superoxide dismutase, Fe-Mn family [Mucilaginibacter lappiensis]